MRKKITLLIASLAFLLGSNELWGQHGVLLPEYQDEEAVPRRGDANTAGDIKEIGRYQWNASGTMTQPGNPGNINNEFGAGETATIKGTKVIAPGTNEQTILKPGWLVSEDIQIGSEYSKNIVILSYNSRGYASGWANIAIWGIPGTGSLGSECAAIGGSWMAWDGSKPDGSFYVNTKEGIKAAQYIDDNIFPQNARKVTYNPNGFNDSYTGNYTTKQWQLYLRNVHGQGSNNKEMVIKTGPLSNSSTTWQRYEEGAINRGTLSTCPRYTRLGGNMTVYFGEDKPYWVPYTSLATAGTDLPTPPVTSGGSPFTVTNYVDDGVPLIQMTGDFIQNLADYDAGASTESKKSDIDNDNTATTLNNYKRPTTVAIEGETNVSNLFITDLNWWYDRYDARYTGNGTGKDQFIGEYSMGAGVMGTGASGCIHIDNVRVYVNDVAFEKNVHNSGNTEKGQTFLDAAIQLIDGAKVCVKNDVKDQTANIASSQSDDATNTPNYSETNALIALPVTDRVTFRTAGNFQMNMNHERNLATTDNVKYTATNFPDPDSDIYLYLKKSSTLSDDFNTPGNLSEFNNTSITQHAIAAPAVAAAASIFGVYGDYDFAGNMARIHTDTVATGGSFNGKVPGVIEVGPTTAGKKYYNVYTSGILKNFEGCNAPNNFTMNFGNTFGEMPHFAFTEKEPMYILNYGNNGNNAGCIANIHFYGGAPDSLTEAFANAADEGALQIQALSDVEFRATTTINATKEGNNLYLLSDGGNVVTQKFDIVSDWKGNVGEGLITFWAEDRLPAMFSLCPNTDANRNAKRGNLYLNDSVRITRTATSGSGTETNLIAANNIRTAIFDFNSASTKNDTTNVISRKGDIYLGYSTDATVYDDLTASPYQTGYDYNRNVFTYNITNTDNAGVLNIKAGYDDQNNGTQYGGGNIYFTHINANMVDGGTYPTNITIPFSNEYFCNSLWSGEGMLHERLDLAYPNAMKHYEHAGIIGGVGRCGTDASWGDYGGQLLGSSAPSTIADTISLIYRANNGNLLVDAGTRGNIIMNRGTYLDFQNNNANAFFLTRYGDIDMRYPTDVENLMGSVLFLANSELPNKLDVKACGCDEQRNNVYLQDFQFKIDGGEGSIFIGADNNIKLQYGGLKDIGTQRDPFLSDDTEYPCGTGGHHCDSDTSANQARDLILDFNDAAVSGKGGFAAVSSDLIDVYKNLIYTGGSSGQGMSSVPNYGSLHGESVAGYGLYIKTQANKNNWDKTDHGVNSSSDPTEGAACEDDICLGDAFLHQTARVTFHADARLYPENQKIYIGSPVLDTYGNAEYNTHLNKGSKTSILIQADSLIYHDSLIIDGNKTQFTTWSGLYRDMPIIKLGHQRFTPPFKEDDNYCAPCYSHTKGGPNGLDTIFVTYRNDASMKRLHTLVADHAVISFLTDSFDHIKGNPVLNAKFYTDTFKIRNHVELFKYADHTRDGHFELISERQMESKDYAGIYSRHLHMEPIAPTCTSFGYSQLWLQDPGLDVITSSTFGGFGWLHTDVHVENDANLSPGYASLRHDGNCYEQKAGILKMQDLRLDGGANLTFSLGDKASPFVETYDCPQTFESINLGEYADCLDVDSLTIYGSVNMDVVIRPEGLILNPGESRCFPVIRYKSVDEGILNHLKMKKLELTSKDHKSIEGKYYLTLDVDTNCNIVYICVATIPNPVIRRPINIPSVPGVTSNPLPGTHYVTSSGSFKFTLKFDSEPPLKVLTGRIINGEPEEIFGTKNANGEYVYVINHITGPIQLAIGPDYASENPNSNEGIDGALVWSHNNTLYIKVDRDDIASIYSVAGQLVKKIELNEGSTSVPMERGVYIVTLNDGSVHKVIIK